MEVIAYIHLINKKFTFILLKHDMKAGKSQYFLCQFHNDP